MRIADARSARLEPLRECAVEVGKLAAVEVRFGELAKQQQHDLVAAGFTREDQIADPEPVAHQLLDDFSQRKHRVLARATAEAAFDLGKRRSADRDHAERLVIRELLDDPRERISNRGQRRLGLRQDRGGRRCIRLRHALRIGTLGRRVECGASQPQATLRASAHAARTAFAR